MNRIAIIGAAAWPILVASSTVAQDFSSVGEMGMAMGSATVGQVVANATLNPNLQRRAGTGARGSLGYVTSVALEQRAKADVLARVPPSNAAGAQALRAVFATLDTGPAFRAMTAGWGLRDGDAGDILTAHTVLGYRIANDETMAPDPRGIAALRSAIVRRLGAVRQLADPAARATFGESLKLKTVMLDHGWQSARRSGTLPQFRDGVAQRFLEGGSDLRRVRLTPAGFVAR